MRYCSRCRTRTVRCCDTEGDPVEIPGPTEPSSDCSALAGGSCVHLAGMFSLAAIFSMAGMFSLAGMLCPGQDVLSDRDVLPDRDALSQVSERNQTNAFMALESCCIPDLDGMKQFLGLAGSVGTGTVCALRDGCSGCWILPGPHLDSFTSDWG